MQVRTRDGRAHTEVLGRAAESLRERAEAHCLFAQPEVGDFDVPSMYSMMYV